MGVGGTLHTDVHFMGASRQPWEALSFTDWGSQRQVIGSESQSSPRDPGPPDVSVLSQLPTAWRSRGPC